MQGQQNVKKLLRHVTHSTKKLSSKNENLRSKLVWNFIRQNLPRFFTNVFFKLVVISLIKMLHKYYTYWHLNESQLVIEPPVSQRPRYCWHITSSKALMGDRPFQGVYPHKQSNTEKPKTWTQAPAGIWKNNPRIRAKDDSSDRRTLRITLALKNKCSKFNLGGPW